MEPDECCKQSLISRQRMPLFKSHQLTPVKFHPVTSLRTSTVLFLKVHQLPDSLLNEEKTTIFPALITSATAPGISPSKNFAVALAEYAVADF